MIEVLVRPQFEGDLSVLEIERAAQTTLLAETGSSEAELTIVITDDREIRALNRQYRDVDAPTDVLSFASGDDADFVTAPDEAPYLGDIVVSLPRAEAQASERGHTTLREVQLLIVHGVLHLLGYDHATDVEQAQMWSRQDDILETLSEANHG